MANVNGRRLHIDVQKTLNVVTSLIALVIVAYGFLATIGVNLPTPVSVKRDLDSTNVRVTRLEDDRDEDRRLRATAIDEERRWRSTILAVTCTRLTQEQFDLIPECVNYRRTPRR